MDKQISNTSALRGTIAVPGDKSISHRSVMIAALSDGQCEIEGFLNAADPLSTVSCCNALGIEYRNENGRFIVNGKGLYGLKPYGSILDAGNSGTTIRLLSGILAGQPFTSIITGDQYLVKRPMKRIIDPLSKMGAIVRATDRMTAPLTIEGKYPLTAIDYELPVASAQVKSAVLFAGLFAEGETRVTETEPSRDHTERMLQLPSFQKDGKKIISVIGGTRLPAQSFLVPGDPSSAAFFIVAGLIVQNSEVVVQNVGLNPTRTGFLDVLGRMGANIAVENRRIVSGEPVGDIIARFSEMHSDIRLEGDIIPNIIDEIPILSIAASFSSGTFVVRNASELRHKETDRIAAICYNLRKMGNDVEEYEDGFAFESKNNFFHQEFNSFDDHRIAMAFGIASLALHGNSTITGSECVSISFPSFWDLLGTLRQ